MSNTTSEENKTTKAWYIVHARASCENKVARSLRERIEFMGLSHMFGDIIVPTQDLLEIRKGEKRKVSRKVFPGYILVNMEMNDETWYLVNKTPNVLRFLGGKGDKPVPLNAKEAQEILQALQENADKPRPKVLFSPGEKVRITTGPFVDFTGTIKEVDYEKKNRLRVSVFVFGQDTTVDVEFFQVEKVT